VVVPEGGQVWFDGNLNAKGGARQQYTTAALDPGKTHVVNVKARWVGADGKDANWDLPIRARAGDVMTVDLTKIR
jgi:uncharacterized protein (TIGR03000 family)